jgi:hypothetical protein
MDRTFVSPHPEYLASLLLPGGHTRTQHFASLYTVSAKTHGVRSIRNQNWLTCCTTSNSSFGTKPSARHPAQVRDQSAMEPLQYYPCDARVQR